MLFYYLTFLFNIFAVISSIIMVYAKSPVRSVFSLITTFFFVTLVFIQLNVHFATLVLLLVYLGAVIVMFLILVMFINIRIYKTSNIEMFIVNIYVIVILSLFTFFLYNSLLYFDFFIYYLKWFHIFDNMDILPTLCFHIFNLLSIEVFLVVFILLISMISSMAIVFIEVQNLWNSKKVSF